MADKRINALATTAPNTASDDFFAVDGTTNGTRKLNAFSPTFGGNATVTGNLTVNTALSVTNGVSANELTCTGGYAVLRGFGGSADTGALYLGQSTNNNFISSNLTTMASYIANTAITSTVAAGFRVLTTTASTTTSSGALVVGNGTSGGLGVGGAIVAGDTITSTTSTNSGVLQLNLVNSSTGTSASSLFRFNAGTRTATLQAYNDTHATLAGQLRIATSNGDISIIPSGVLAATFSSSGLTLTGAFQAGTFVKSANTAAANGSQFDALRAEIGADGTLGPLVVNVGGLPSATAASRYAYIYAGDAGTTRKLYVGGIPTGGSQVLIPATDISSSTSSGALVVSGGVGVAGAINCGGDITAPTTANITGGRFTSVNSNSYIEQSGSDFNYVTASTRPHVFSIGGTTRFQVTTSGIISSLPASAASLTANSTMTFELTSNTSLKIFVRGSDGTTRSTTLTLA